MKLIDTNVWVHALSRDSPKKEKAQDLTNALMGLGEAAVSTQNILELYSAMTKTMSPETAAYWSERFLDTKAVVKFEVSIEDVRQALKDAWRLKLRRAEVYDALLVATAKRNGITVIVTENQKDFEGFGMEIETV